MMGRPWIRLARRDEGFGLIELLIAMTLLSVALLALFAAYSSGYAALTRSTRVASATLLADSQMDRYRALQYANIQLNTSCGATCTQDSTYTGDSAYSSTAQVTGCSTTDASCIPTQTKTGPDGKSYRVDSFVAYSCISGTLSTSPSLTCGSGQPIPVKLVTVVVRKSSGGTWTREQSTFTALTGT
jgi:prepilin-type N-terminal cleavage/methylation domain-containing protein